MVTPKSKAGCTGEPQTFNITVYPKSPLYVNLGNDTIICWLDSLILNAGHPTVNQYQWQDNSTGNTYTVYYNGQYWVTVSNRCSKASDTINVTYLRELKVNLGKDLIFCEDDIIYKVFNVNSPYASYLWQDGTTSSVYTVEHVGIYSVTVSNICMSVSDEIEVKTKDCSVLELWIPNAFTPGEDGINDLFKIEINSPELLKEYEMAIYSRWGNLIFVTNDYQTGWNGKDRKNRDCSQGIYVAIVKYKDSENQIFIKRSSVTLLR